MTSKDIDLKGEQDKQNPEVINIKNKLTNDAEKEKQRKERRKEQAINEENKETPTVDIKEDLGQPAPSPAAPKVTPAV